MWSAFVISQCIGFTVHFLFALGGRTFVRLKDARRTELPVSRAYAHLFRQM